MAESDVKKALVKAAVDFLGGQGFPAKSIQWENRAFDPGKKTKWASVFHVPNTPTVVSIGQGGLDRATGFLQIDFNIPQNKGDGALNTWADAARAEFVAGKSFNHNGQFVTIINTGTGPGRNVDSWFRKSLTITYRADITRPRI